MSRSLLSREDRAGLLALRRREGLRFRELSAAAGIGDATRPMWERRERAARRDAKFVEAEVPAPPAGSALELVVGDRTVRLPTGFGAGWLRQLLPVGREPRAAVRVCGGVRLRRAVGEACCERRSSSDAQ